MSSTLEALRQLFKLDHGVSLDKLVRGLAIHDDAAAVELFHADEQTRGLVLAYLGQLQGLRDERRAAHAFA
jgi:hypothetical protein